MSIDELPIEVIKSIDFIKDLKKLRKRYNSVEKDVEFLILQLKDGETPGDRITENKYPVYKARVKNSDTRRGKSGSYRVIYYICTHEAILLTKIYSKSDRSDISNKEVEDVMEQYELEIDRQEPEVAISEPEELEDEDRSTS